MLIEQGAQILIDCFAKFKENSRHLNSYIQILSDILDNTFEYNLQTPFNVKKILIKQVGIVLFLAT